MREFELLIDEALVKGLSPTESMPVNSQFLYQCNGFRCYKAGLRPHKLMTNPMPPLDDMYYQWPFPQFIQGNKWNILVIRDPFQLEDSVYSVSDDFQTITKIFDVDQLTFGQGGLMEVVDFGSYIFMTNGVVMIYYYPDTGSWNKVTSHSDIPMMKTLCNFKGQVVGGNVASSWHDCDETYYVWSRIGEMNFTPDRRNTEGYRRDPYGGEVYNVRRLDDLVVGYSSKGITFIYPVNSPAVTFGFKEMLDIGVINQGAIDESFDRHVFVGSDYKLYQVNKEGVTELDYQQHIETLAGEDIIVRYDKDNKDFYIGNSTKTYLLSPVGLTEVMQHPSAVWNSGKNVYCLPVAVDDEVHSITTLPFDFQYKGQKLIAGIETDMTKSTTPKAGVDINYDHSNWKSPNLVPLNNIGFAAMYFTGNLFRFKLTFEDVENDSSISYIKVRYKMNDLRGIRGVYASGLRGQTE